MNILVTGGAGYIGSVTTAQLVDAGHTVIVYDNLSKGHKDAVHKDATLVIGDVADSSKVTETIKKYNIEGVMHFAAYIEAGESMKVPEKYFHNNTSNTLALLETLIKNDIRILVFSSTAAVYGNPKQIPITEDAPLLPTNAYGASKLLVEHVLSWYNQIYGFRYAALRYFNACGATETLGENHQPESHLIPIALETAMGKRNTLQLFGTDYPTKDGTCIRDYIHVSDLAHAHLLALNALNEGKKDKLIYNLGSQHGFSNRQVIEAVERVVGKKIQVQNAPRRSGDPSILIASSEKIYNDLGWIPSYIDIEEIITSAYTWHKNHPTGYTV